MKILTIIPARSGSKGIKDKNIINFAGMPLISWTIRQAKNAELNKNDNKIIVSTDSKQYKEKIDSWFQEDNLVPFIRPSRLARDDTPTSRVILHALDMYPDYDTFVLLEPTAPLRLTKDITLPLSYIREGKCQAVVSVCDSHRCHPAISFRMNRSFIQPNADIPSPRRQALEPFFHQTGTVYAAKSDWYRQHLTFITPKTMGYVVQEWQDKEVDTEDDLIAIQSFMERVK